MTTKTKSTKPAGQAEPAAEVVSEHGPEIPAEQLPAGADVQVVDQAEPAAADGCNVPGCRRKPTNRGLCPAHWQTHRGLATPKEDSPDA